MATPDFLGNTLQQILGASGSVANLGQLVGAPIANALIQNRDIERQQAERAVDLQRQDEAIGRQQSEQNRQIRLQRAGSEALSVLNQPPELRQQALSGLLTQAQQSGDNEKVQALGQLMQMDNVGLESSLQNIVFQAGNTLPGGAASLIGGGASDKNIGGKTNFVKRVGKNEAGEAVFQNFASTLTQGREGVTSEETPFGPQFTRKEGNPIVSSKVEAAGSAAFTKAKQKILGEAEVVDIKANIAAEVEGSKEQKKLQAQLVFKPRISKAIALAQVAADDEEKLAAKVANMPVLLEMASSLRDLAPIATHTTAGKTFNLLVKELGFGATKGSTARAKYQALISNQMLPLLKATFGAAFTEVEGQKLEATLGDPNASPAEKMAQLEVFLTSQQNQISTLERKINPDAVAPQSTPFVNERLQELRAKAGL